MKIIVSMILMLSMSLNFAQDIALLKYDGGGDWYSNPTALPNLVEFINTETQSGISKTIGEVKPEDPALFQYAFVHLTGHGNIYFTEDALRNLRLYLLSGGFLHADDNYGLEPYITRELKRLFPEKELKELPSNHPIFSSVYEFKNGLPKIHEHDNKPPQAFGIEDDSGRLMILFTYESDLGNGWEDPSVHNDPQKVRLQALKMGANILKYVFVN